MNYIFKDLFTKENVKLEDIAKSNISINTEEHSGNKMMSFDYEFEMSDGVKGIIEHTITSPWKTTKKGNVELEKWNKFKNNIGDKDLGGLMESYSPYNVIDNIIIAIKKKNKKAYLKNNEYKYKILLLENPLFFGFFAMRIHSGGLMSNKEELEEIRSRISSLLDDGEFLFNNIIMVGHKGTVKESYIDLRNGTAFDDISLFPEIANNVIEMKKTFFENYSTYNILKKKR